MATGWSPAPATWCPTTDVIPISERLKPLEFLIGDWVDESEEAMIAGSYRWGEGRKFLTHEFTVKRAGSPLLKGTQRIGWDPLRHTIMSWTFDSRGGHGEGTWTWDRNHWLIKMQGVSAAGQPSSATAFLTPLGRTPTVGNRPTAYWEQRRLRIRPSPLSASLPSRATLPNCKTCCKTSPGSSRTVKESGQSVVGRPLNIAPPHPQGMDP